MSKTLRLTFQAIKGKIQLVSHDMQEMICPPSIGECPEIGRHGGFWMELRDKNEHVLFHHDLDNQLGNSAEVHSPDGKIQRKFGPVKENVFEILLPYSNKAKNIVLIGEPFTATSRARTKATTQELARFDVLDMLKDNHKKISRKRK